MNSLSKALVIGSGIKQALNLHAEFEEEKELTTSEIYTYIGISVLLTIVAGFMSGLTIGLASIDALDLELMKMTGTEKEKISAINISRVVKRHHWMLCTLLLCNAGCMEALPLFLDKLLPAAAAIIVSVTCVLFFGEIIPQALATGPK
jgi:metal transporter CNNM